jgi:hypothetical protein
MPKVVLKDHYTVLGVTSDADAAQIKGSYRRLAKECHPDVLGPDATAEAIEDTEEHFRQIRLAYEQLSDPDCRAAIDKWLEERNCSDFSDWWSDADIINEWKARTVVVPEPAWYDVNGISYYAVVRRRQGSWLFTEFLVADITVKLDDLFLLPKFLTPPHGAFLENIIVVDDHGDVVYRGDSLITLRFQGRLLLAEKRRNEERRKWREQLVQLEGQLEGLTAQGKPVERLKELIAIANRRIDSGIKTLRDAVSTDTVMQALREVEKELKWAQDTDAVELLLADLMEGRLEHTDLEYNQQLLYDMRILAFRTAGDYTAPTDDEVAEHYRQRLQGFTSHWQALKADLRLVDDQPTFMELVKEGVANWAPDTVEVQGIKRPTPYAVTYGFSKVNGETLPVGVIEVSEGTYERNAARHGRDSQFPSLPYGITLLIRVRVEVQGKTLLSDPMPDGKVLQNEVQRCRARLKNPVEADIALDTLTLLYRSYIR